MQRHYIIHGRVQGVFFRDSTRRKARELGVRGWVRNRPEGTVEVMAAGDEAALDALERWFRDGGPPAARVERVEREDVPEEALDGFRVR
jgi:acylphosphatase